MLSSILVAGILGVLTAATPVISNNQAYDNAEGESPPDAELLMQQIHQDYVKNTRAHLIANGSCTAENITVRKEWYVSS